MSFFPLMLFFVYLLKCSSVFLYFIIFACYRRFLICVSNRISHPGFDFLFVFFKGNSFFHNLISLLCRLVHLIRWSFSLRKMLILYWFYPFLGYGEVVFVSSIILFKFSKWFLFRVLVFAVLFGFMGVCIFISLRFILLDCSSLSLLSLSDIVSVSCLD